MASILQRVRRITRSRLSRRKATEEWLAIVSLLLIASLVSVVGADAGAAPLSVRPATLPGVSTAPTVMRARYDSGVKLFSYDRRRPLGLRVLSSQRDDGVRIEDVTY